MTTKKKRNYLAAYYLANRKDALYKSSTFVVERKYIERFKTVSDK